MEQRLWRLLTISWRRSAQAPGGRRTGTLGLPKSQKPLLLLMDRGESYDLDTLAALSGLGGGDLLARVLELELQGRIVRSGVGRFSRSWGWW